MAMSVFLSMLITIDESQLLHFCRMTAAVLFFLKSPVMSHS